MPKPPTYDRLVAAELRAEAARRRMPATVIAGRAALPLATVRRRMRGEGHIHFDQLDAIARAMGTTARAIQTRALDVADVPRAASRRERVAR